MPTDKELYDQFLYEQFQQEQSGGVVSEEIPNIKEQMHPAVSWKDRALVKNLASPQGGLKYLQEKYPNLEVKEFGGRVLMKGANEDQYSVLDPEGFDLQDITDVGVDVAQGIIEGGATAAGALAGGGLASIPAAIAAGGAAGAGTEALKQKIAQELGLREDISGTDVAISGAFGAASPLLFGAGVGAKQAAKAGLTEFAQKGALGTAKDSVAGKVLPQLAEFTSGVPKKVYKTFLNNTDEIVNMTDDDMIARSVNVFDTIEEGAQALKSELGEQYNVLKDSGQAIDMSSVHDDLLGEIQRLSGRGTTNSEKEAAKGLQELYENAFTIDGELIPVQNVDFDMAMKIKDEIAARSQFNKNLGDLTPAQRVVGGKVKASSEGLYSKTNKAIEDSINSFGPLKAKYADYKQVEKFLNSFKTGKGAQADYGEKAVDALTKMDSKSAKQVFKNQNLKDIASRFGVDIENEADIIRAYNMLKDPSFMPIQGSATTTSRTLASGVLGGLAGMQAGDGGGVPLAAGVGAGLVAGSPAMWKKYFKAGRGGADAVRNLQSKMPLTPQQRANIWMNMAQGQSEE